MPDARPTDESAARIAAAIGEPARARMLYCLMDGRSRTSTELALVGEVSPSTASIHLARLKREHLVSVMVQGKHHYYSLGGPDVARVLEGLSGLAGEPRRAFVPATPTHLRAARTCYDHVAGALGVAIYDRLQALGWLAPSPGEDGAHDLTPKGVAGFEALEIDVESARASRRHFAVSCLDWSERRSHLGGALGAALLRAALKKKWLARERDSRAVRVTTLGDREFGTRLGIRLAR